MRSMTGFGQASAENERFRATVTLRGVNHRFLDLSMRLRDELRREEPVLREMLSSRLWRGRVEVSVEVTAIGARGVEISVEREVANAVRDMAASLKDDGIISGELAFGDLLRLPELIRLDIPDPEWAGEDRTMLLDVVENALEQLIAARTEEGAKILPALESRLESLRGLTTELAERRRQTTSEYASSLRGRIADLLVGEAVDEDRLAQEVAYLVDRSDVSEELDRLQSHFDHLGSILAQDGSIGKRLDFLIQEIFRELNTLGSKCRDSVMTRLVLDAKVLCEQLREQVQNIE